MNRYPMLVSACAVALVTGCAQLTTASGDADKGTPVQRSAGAAPAPLKVEPVYRVGNSRPAGTAAGQYAVGRLALNEGRLQAAILRFRQALELDPDFLDAYNGLGVAYGQAGRFAEAADAFRAALAVDPARAHLLSNLGYAQFRAGQLDEAWASLRQSYELEPRNDKTRENLKQVADAILARKGGGGRSMAQEPAVARTAEKPAANEGRSAAFDVVVSSTPESTLVQLAPNVYELRSLAAPVLAEAPVQTMRTEVSAAQVSAEVSVEPVPARRVQVSSVLSAPEPGRGSVPMLREAISRVSVAPSSNMAAPGMAVPVGASTMPAVSKFSFQGLEVSNGVGLPSLAGRTARQLKRHGVDVLRVSDYRNFDVARTEIHYRAGHEAGARALQARLPVEVRLVRASNLFAGINLRLVVGRDLVSGPVAWWQEETDSPEVATIEAPPMIGLSLEAASMALATPAAGGWRHL